MVRILREDRYDFEASTEYSAEFRVYGAADKLDAEFMAEQYMAGDPFLVRVHEEPDGAYFVHIETLLAR